MTKKKERPVTKRILVIEDILELKLIESLFNRNVGQGKYELTTILDLSDEGVYKRHLPEEYDVYWLHTSSTEFDAIEEIRREQHWSKMILRGALRDEGLFVDYLKRISDHFIPHGEKIDEKKVIETFKLFGVELVLPVEVKI